MLNNRAIVIVLRDYLHFEKMKWCSKCVILKLNVGMFHSVKDLQSQIILNSCEQTSTSTPVTASPSMMPWT